jgi:maltose alpha-D-glucosyltransferase/alpha-amylase
MALGPDMYPGEGSAAPASLWRLSQVEAPPHAKDLMGGFLQSGALLGQRTAEMHMALASADDPAFSPEPFTQLYQRSIYQSLRKLTVQKFHLLKRKLRELPADLQSSAKALLDREPHILERFRAILGQKIKGARIRCHGDYHLGQVLYTGRDFIIIDFEGEPARTLTERRIKRSPLVDVAGMIRSFHYASLQAFFRLRSTGLTNAENVQPLKRAAGFWYSWTSASFLRAYLETIEKAPGLIPTGATGTEMLMQIHLLEKAVYELGYELNNRPDWVEAPLMGIWDLLGERE